MSIQFTKMQALGNDFMVIDGVAQAFDLSTAQIQRLADRRFGVGFDQLLLIEPATVAKADFKYRIFNADGSEVGQCGNGARCVARFIHDQGLSFNKTLRLQTQAGFMTTELLMSDEVKVSLGIPDIIAQEATVIIQDQPITFCAIAVGNPHAIIFVENVEQAPVTTLGPLLEHDAFFPAGANVSFVEIINQTQIKQRVWERGVGPTLACGSAACAAVIAGCVLGKLSTVVQVQFPLGVLQVSWQGVNNEVFLTGPATTVFSGSAKA